MEKITEPLPAFLVRTPEQIKADDEVQAARRASFGRGHLTEAEALLSRAVATEEARRADIKFMQELRAVGHRVSTRGGASKKMIDHQQKALADSLAAQGRYLEAAEIHPRKRRAAEYRAIHEAIERDDELCACPRDEGFDPLTHQEMSLSPRRNLRNVYSRKHSGMVALMFCDKCKTLNARPLTGQAAEIAGAVAGSTMAVKTGMRVTVSDAQVLRKKSA